MENISVYVRIKPKAKSDDNIWRSDSNSLISLKNPKEIFTFSNLTFYKI